MFHGSRLSNWGGLLSRGIVLPKVVVSMGVKAGSPMCCDVLDVLQRTDPGWLGHGIYFGHADTAAGYAGHSSKRGSKFMLMLSVALGKVKDYSAITFGLNAPPKVGTPSIGYSIHGCRALTRATAWPARSSTTTSMWFTTPRSRRPNT